MGCILRTTVSIFFLLNLRKTQKNNTSKIPQAFQIGVHQTVPAQDCIHSSNVEILTRNNSTKQAIANFQFTVPAMNGFSSVWKSYHRTSFHQTLHLSSPLVNIHRYSVGSTDRDPKAAISNL